MGLLADQIKQRLAADGLRQSQRRRLVDPHQRRVQDEGLVHAEPKRWVGA
jgi:hypothetical protein